jgi:peptidoglycan/xylan/chitin deacetylase (PgdA/CDA1 family)
MRSTSPVSHSLPHMLLLLALVALTAQAQDKDVWNGKRCAVALTYDDALDVHLDHVVPLLDSLGFRGTFYLSPFFPSFRRRIPEWVSVAKEGHELGNHTLFHPCEGKAPGREWVSPDYDLNKYSLRRMIDEIQMANILLQAMDGKRKRTFAYPCGDRKAGDSSYVGLIRGLFPGARGVEGKMQRMEEIDSYDIGAYVVNGQSGEELVHLVREAMANNALVVFLFHGVGGEHSLNVSVEDHHRLLSFLKANERDIWVAPMSEICEYVKAKR